MSLFNLTSARPFKTVLTGAALCAALALSACGFRPLHGSHSSNPQAQSHLSAIAVSPIQERVGQQMRTALEQKLDRSGGSMTKSYDLSVTIAESISQLAIERDAFATRANLRLTATYNLVRIADGLSLNSGDLKTVASYNILSSDFATLRAEQNARQNAVQNLAADLYTRLATYFQGPGLNQPPLQNRARLR